MKLIGEEILVRDMGIYRDMRIYNADARPPAWPTSQPIFPSISLPTSFLWRTRLYRVHQVQARWRWRGAWWTTPNLCGHQRTYFLVLCVASHSGELCVELYCEENKWVLSRLTD